MTDRILHVSIGPVQGFVAQARRTRDLWAGSFLLSWMAGQLMAAVLRHGGRIVFPCAGTEQTPDDPMLAAILGRPLPDNPDPRIGTLPNRFKASVTEAFDPEACVGEARRKWQELAEVVWRQFVADAGRQGRDSRNIWERQIDGFWDIQWIMDIKSKDGRDATWLDQRKNWRSHWPPPEGGDHCTAMGDWQEMSGFVRSRERQRQDAFWRALRSKTGRLDLREGERLCAIALVKRLFPKLKGQEAEKVIGWQTGAVNWPSTTYMATVPWLAHLAGDPTRRSAFDRYVETVRDAVGSDTFSRLCGERATRLPQLEPLGQGADLDGNLFLRAALENRRATPLNDDEPTESGAEEDSDSAPRKRLSKALADLCDKAGGPAQPFYAVLLMDGDRLGKMLRQHGEQTVSGALARFVGHVPDIVREHNGITVYAGGDDVLAMLPIDHAIKCAIALRERYDLAFAHDDPGGDGVMGRQATASCAIVFAHYRNPMREVLALAHGELDDVAKASNGRDSLALAVMLSGGVNQRWVGRFGTLPKALVCLCDRIAADDHHYSAGFFYGLRERYAAVMDGLSPDDRRAVILAEYTKGALPRDDEERRRAETAVDLLLAACRKQRGEEAIGDDSSFQVDGMFVARFLAETRRFAQQVLPQ